MMIVFKHVQGIYVTPALILAAQKYRDNLLSAINEYQGSHEYYVR